MVVRMRNVPDRLVYLNSWSLVHGSMGREGHRTSRRWSFVKRRMPLGSQALKACSLTLLPTLTLCFLCVDENVIRQLPVPVDMPCFPHLDRLYALKPSAKINSFVVKLPLAMVFYHSNREVTNTEIKDRVID